MTDWLSRWQQREDDVLLDTPQYSGSYESTEPTEGVPLTAASLQQMAHERWLDEREDEEL